MVGGKAGAVQDWNNIGLHTVVIQHTFVVIAKYWQSFIVKLGVCFRWGFGDQAVGYVRVGVRAKSTNINILHFIEGMLGYELAVDEEKTPIVQENQQYHPDDALYTNPDWLCPVLLQRMQHM